MISVLADKREQQKRGQDMAAEVFSPIPQKEESQAGKYCAIYLSTIKRPWQEHKAKSKWHESAPKRRWSRWWRGQQGAG